MTQKRDWFVEAIEIAHGNKRQLKVNKNHVVALVNKLTEMATRFDKLNQLMVTAYENACEARRLRGLPIPPVPESLRGYVKP